VAAALVVGQHGDVRADEQAAGGLGQQAGRLQVSVGGGNVVTGGGEVV
jgi:hypothetical protein